MFITEFVYSDVTYFQYIYYILYLYTTYIILYPKVILIININNEYLLKVKYYLNICVKT